LAPGPVNPGKGVTVGEAPSALAGLRSARLTAAEPSHPNRDLRERRIRSPISSWPPPQVRSERLLMARLNQGCRRVPGCRRARKFPQELDSALGVERRGCWRRQSHPHGQGARRRAWRTDPAAGEHRGPYTGRWERQGW